MQQGWDAMRDLWSRKYANKPLEQALAQWSNAGKDQGNYNAIAMGGSQSSPTMAAAGNSGQTLTQANATASQTAAANQQQQKPPEVNIDFKELGKALASRNMGGSFAMATPYDRDFYAGITKTAAL
jgi:hypothetical protein